MITLSVFSNRQKISRGEVSFRVLLVSESFSQTPEENFNCTIDRSVVVGAVLMKVCLLGLSTLL